VLVGVLGEGLDLGYKGEQGRGVVPTAERVRLEVVVLVSALQRHDTHLDVVRNPSFLLPDSP
jgi:hypothetical protein